MAPWTTVRSAPDRIAHGKEVVRAARLIRQARFDSAEHVLHAVYARLDKHGLLSTATGLQARLHLAYILERKGQYPEAVALLLPLVDEARAVRDGEVLAEAYLHMALIYEQQRQAQRCLEYLGRARSVIADYGLTEPLARLANRSASYERMFGNRDQALFYAYEGVRLGKRHAQPTDQATGHLLLSILLRLEDTAESERQLERAAELYLQAGGEIDYYVVLLNLSHVQITNGAYRKALQSNTKAMEFVRSAPEEVQELIHYTPTLHKYRGEIFQQLGEYDSAIYYLQLSHAGELKLAEELAAERVAEVESEYASEYNQQLIASQRMRLRSKQVREWWLSLVMLAILFGTAVLLALYRRLQRANASLAGAAEQLSQRNDALSASLSNEQLLLGEVHHRVKNNLQIIVGLLDRQLEDITDPAARAGLQSMSGRVFSMASVHQTLYQEGKLGEVNLLSHIKRLCRHFEAMAMQREPVQYTYRLDDLWLKLDTVIPLAMILNELLTNSYKYATQAGRILKINISLDVLDGVYELSYRDNGPGYPQGVLQDRSGGLGAYLLHGMARQLRGEIHTTNKQGAVTTIRFRVQSTSTVAMT
ncbi:sensor histidine kinase [Neolewinella maritima]|uniref:sensor histidine kinase n=1 Tax=Neolewinella maritima TaxID=1383882 RepID=UPI001EE950FB|nr:histidine kinase dimerization/phosphoacceptor domain -containing protein [Neolewinella maritima]